MVRSDAGDAAASSAAPASSGVLLGDAVFISISFSALSLILLGDVLCISSSSSSSSSSFILPGDPALLFFSPAVAGSGWGDGASLSRKLSGVDDGLS